MTIKKKISTLPLRRQIADAKDVGILQGDIAKLVGITPQSMSDIVRGANIPSIRTTIKLCEVFNCNIEDILQVKDVEEESLEKESLEERENNDVGQD